MGGRDIALAVGHQDPAAGDHDHVDRGLELARIAGAQFFIGIDVGRQGFEAREIALPEAAGGGIGGDYWAGGVRGGGDQRQGKAHSEYFDHSTPAPALSPQPII